MNFNKKLYGKEDLEVAHQDFEKYGIVFFDKILSDNVFKEAEVQMNRQVNRGVDTDSLVNLHLSDEWFANFVSRREFTNIACKLLGSDSIKVFSSLIINKPARGMMTVPWHQDAAYDWPIDPIDCASLWLAFDDVTVENGAMKVAVGAHKKGAFEMVETAQLEEGDLFFSSQLQRSIPESKFKDQGCEIIDVTMKKSHSSFHHSMLPHCSTPNNTDYRRCAFVIRYCHGNAKLNKFPGMKREEYFKNYELFEPVNNK